jgi:hypothetical protein
MSYAASREFGTYTKNSHNINYWKQLRGGRDDNSK